MNYLWKTGYIVHLLSATLDKEDSKVDDIVCRTVYETHVGCIRYSQSDNAYFDSVSVAEQGVCDQMCCVIRRGSTRERDKRAPSCKCC